MDHIEITMQHSESTVRRLAKVQYNTFYGFAKIGWYLICGLCILIGLNILGGFPDIVRYLLLAFGSIAIVNIGTSGHMRADKTLAAIKNWGEFPRTTLRFREEYVEVTDYIKGANTRSVPYSSFIRLVADNEYFYLFVSPDAAYMLPVDQMKDSETCRRFLEQKTGQEFRPPFSFFSFRLSSLFHKKN